MDTISCDLETYSSADLSECGVFRYCESPDFAILLLGYSIDGGAVQVIDLACGEQIPKKIVAAIQDDAVIKFAHNSSFERICLSRFLGLPTGHYLDPKSWHCTMVWAAYMGLPLSLEGAGAVLGLEKQKLAEGKDLIRYFCKPCHPTAANEGRTRNLPIHAPDKWAAFKEYNRRDVEAELAIQDKLVKFPVPDQIWDEYHLDQEINDRGVGLDRELVTRAIDADRRSRLELTQLVQKLTLLDNPNSVAQLKHWLSENGLETETLGKKAVAELLKNAPEPLGKVLSLRQQLAKSSVKKYQAMQNVVCSDGRARGLFMFYGANRTGRYSGRLLQPQNLPAHSMPDLAQARDLLRSGNVAVLELLYDSVPEVLSELIRTAFVPKPGCRFIVADFSAIEARVIAWLAGETWRQQVFAAGGDIYCASASQMFKVPVEKHGVNGHLRQKGKQAELACIAEGQQVLTDIGLVPIEKITDEHKLWDGESWVSHGGLIEKGIREVIDYDGLTATPDHLVWVEGSSQPIPLGIAASSGACLIQAGNGRIPIRLGADKKPQREKPATCRRTARLYDIRDAGPHHRFTVSGKLVHNCGYGGSVGALKAMGALDMGLTEDELQPLVTAWRKANPKIVRFWHDVDRAVKTAVKERTATVTHGIRFSYQSGMLFITLPSGRKLAYVKPRIELNQFGSECVTYEGVGGTKKWERIESRGPKFVENITQAISRDILCHAMKSLRHYAIVMHIHDEIVIETDWDLTVESVCPIMGQTPPWAEGLLLRADGFECHFYQKA